MKRLLPALLALTISTGAAAGPLADRGETIDGCVRLQMGRHGQTEVKATERCRCLFELYDSRLSERDIAAMDDPKTQAEVLKAILWPINRAVNDQCFGGARLLPE